MSFCIISCTFVCSVQEPDEYSVNRKKNESWALIQWIVDGHEYSYQFNLRRFIFVSFGPLFTTLAYFTGLGKLSCSWRMANSITQYHYAGDLSYAITKIGIRQKEQ